MTYLVNIKTEIHPLNICNNNHYFIKRDDLLPFSFGGNKVRKAINFFEDIRIKKSDCVVTYGSSSSNHCRVVSNFAAFYGISCYIISPEENYIRTINSDLSRLFGATTIRCSIDRVETTIKELLKQLSDTNKKPYFIQGGGHGNLGTQAYVDAYIEIMQQEKEHNIKFDYIFHASGTGTTQAGLICGKIINNDFERSIIGISIARKSPYGREIIQQSIQDYLKEKNINHNTKTTEVDFIDDYTLGGYGKYNQQILDTIKKVMVTEGVPLDTTYTGKAFYGMEEYLKKNKIKNKNILFIHTGGTPLFFDNLNILVR